MYKHIYYSLLCITILLFIHCNSDFELLFKNLNNQIITEEGLYTFYTDSKDISLQLSPKLEINEDTLTTIGQDCSGAREMFTFESIPYRNIYIAKEFIISLGDTFEVINQNCDINVRWEYLYDQSDNLTVRQDSIDTSDITYRQTYTIKPNKACKGYIGFYEITPIFFSFI